MIGPGGVQRSLQHDGAEAHNGRGNHIDPRTEPSQSPDVNKDDLCVFNALSKVSHGIKAGARTMEAQRDSALEAWEIFEEDKLLRVHAFQYKAYR